MEVKSKKVSICIPVYGSEPYLEACLKSVKSQTFTDYEVIVVNDGSSGVDSNGDNCKKIIKKVKKSLKLPINYIEHEHNRGLLEARRTAIYAAKGEYIFNLDSDDKLPTDALEVLYGAAVETGADIVHGKGELFDTNGKELLAEHTEEEAKKVWEKKTLKIQNVYLGVLKNYDIFKGYLIEHNHCGFLWGKLFKRDLYLEALDKIPPMFCTMAEDVIQYFWLTRFAKKYAGIENCVYFYCADTGVTSNKIIDDLSKWEQVCSVSSVFTAIYTSLEDFNIELKQDEKNAIAGLCCNYIINNLNQLNSVVVPELRKEAYMILCDYWGKDFVSRVETEYKNRIK